MSKYEKWNNSKPWIAKLKNYYKGVYFLSNSTSKIIIPLYALKSALSYVKYQLKLRTGELIDPFYDKWTNCSKKTQQLLENISKISTYNLPYSNEVMKDLMTLEKVWTTPNAYLEYKIIQIVKEMKHEFPQTKMEGVNNVWIMKPSFSSRGIGVFCLNSIKEGLNGGAKMQAKVIQKYIENPLLLMLPGPKGKLEKRKFDFRQWVLVTNFNPLIIYMFNSCYAKICGSEFAIDQLKDKYRHISNYSVQKKNSSVQNVKLDLAMSLQHVKENLKINYNM